MTPGRKKLKTLGIDLPLFPTTLVGSLPKPQPLKKARSDFQKGLIGRDDLKFQEEAATRDWIHRQEEIDIDILVDGEMCRGDMVAYFAEAMEGFEKGGLVRSFGNRFYHKPVIVRPVKWKGPITVECWQFSQRLTMRPVKGMVTGPYTIMDWSFDEHYKNRREATLAIAREVRKEVEALVEAGARIIQIDEPALSVRPDEFQMVREALDICTGNLPAYFVTHICYGALESIYPQLLDLPFDNFDLEFAGGGLDSLELLKKHPFSKDFSAGVVDVHSRRIEDMMHVRKRIEYLAKIVPVPNIWVDPDCGLKTRTEEETIGKLKVMRAAVEEVRLKTIRRAKRKGKRKEL